MDTTKAAAIALALFLAGCSNLEIAMSPVGAWDVLTINGAPPKWGPEVYSFRSDGSMEMTVQDSVMLDAFPGTWTIDGDRLTIAYSASVWPGNFSSMNSTDAEIAFDGSLGTDLLRRR